MYWLSFTAAAAAFTAKVCEPAIDAVLGPYSGDLIKHLLIVAMGAFIQLFILVVEVGRPTRRAVLIRVGIAVLVAGGMIAAFVAAPIHALGGVDDLDESFLGLPEIQVYRLIFNGYLTYVLVDNIRLYRRFAAAPGDAGRSTNLRLVGWGSAVGTGLLRDQAVVGVVRDDHRPAAPVVETVGSVAALVGGVCVALSVFSPRVVPWFRDWHAARSGLRRLAPALARSHHPVPGRGAAGLGRPFSPGEPNSSSTGGWSKPANVCAWPGCRSQRRPASSGQPHPLRALAGELHDHRDGWTSAAGPTAADLLTPAATHVDEVRTLLDLADQYTAAGRVRSAPRIGPGMTGTSRATVRRQRTRLATVVTEASSPAVCVVVGLVVVAWHSANQGLDAAWAGLAILLCAGVPMAYIVKGVKAGKWSDHHISRREQRAIPLLVGPRVRGRGQCAADRRRRAPRTHRPGAVPTRRADRHAGAVQILESLHPLRHRRRPGRRAVRPLRPVGAARPRPAGGDRLVPGRARRPHLGPSHRRRSPRVPHRQHPVPAAELTTPFTFLHQAGRRSEHLPSYS